MTSWLLFFLASTEATVFLFVPGFILALIFGWKLEFALTLAPLGSISIFALLSIVYGLTGIQSGVVSLVVVPTLLLALSLTFKNRWHADGLPAPRGRSSIEIADVLTFIFFGLVIGGLIFVVTLDGPESYLQLYDNVFHLGVVDSFVTTGNYSSLEINIYPGSLASETPYQSASGFYPAVWHIIPALLVESIHISVPMAINAFNFILISMALPCSLLLFLSTIFSDRRSVLKFGFVALLCSAVFPWIYLYKGPQYPNMAATILLPSLCAVFIDFIQEKYSLKERVSTGIFFLVCCVGLALLHPNAIFASIVLLSPFCISEILLLQVSKQRRAVFSFLFACLVVLVWILFLRMPFMQDVLGYFWRATYTRADALSAGFNFSFSKNTPSVMLTILALIGCMAALRNRKYRWLVASWLAFTLLFVLCASTNSDLKRILTGFWYTDAGRIAACGSLACVPLIALGLDVLLSICKKRLGLSPVLTVTLITLSLYLPISNALSGSLFGSPQMGEVYSVLEASNRQSDDQMLGNDEKGFLDKVKNAVPKDSLILNNPYDGSAFAYLFNDLNVYFRRFGPFGDAATETSNLVRYALNTVAIDTDVQEAIEEIGAKYLLLLDCDTDHSREEMHTIGLYRPDRWTGMTSIDDKTPGFSIVLSEGDMRLYRIEY